MFVSKRAFQAAQDQIVQLRRELDSVQSALAQQVERERDVAEAMIAARADAREVRLAAEQDAQALLADARKDADSLKADAGKEADALTADARKAADAMRADAQGEVAAAKTEVARLQDLQRDLTTSFEQKVAALRSALAQAAATHRPAPPENREHQHASAPAPAPLPVPSPAPILAPPTGVAVPPSETVAEIFRDARAETRGLSLFPAAEAPSKIQGVQQVQQVQEVRWVQGGQGARPERSKPRALRRRWLRAGPAVSAAALLAAAAFSWWAWTRAPAASSPAAVLAEKPSPASRPAGARYPAQAAPVSAAAPERPAPAVAVQLQAVRDVWLRVAIDGTNTVNRLVKAGEHFTVGGNRDIVLRAGDAGALLVATSGEAPVVLGRDGAVVTRRFPQSVATSGATPTPSIVPPRPEPPLPAVRPLEPTASPPAKRTERLPAAAPISPAPAVASASPTPVPVPDPPQQEAARPSLPNDPAETTAGATDDEHTVLRGHEQYFQALGRGDRGGITGLLGAAFTTTGAPKLDPSGRPFPISVPRPEVQIRGVGAVVSGTASQRIAGPGGDSRDEPLLFSEVWVKRGSRWELVNVRFLSPAAKK